MSESFYWRSVEELSGDWKGAIKIGPFGSQLKKEDMVESGVKVYGQENVIADDWSVGERRVSKAKFESLRSCELYPGDIVISMMGTIGKCSVFPARAEPGLMDSHLLRIQPDASKVDSAYLATVLQAEDIVGKQVAAKSHGSIMAGLSSSIVRRLQLPVPPIAEQPLVAKILDTLDTQIQKTEALIAKLEQIKQGLLHDLLTRGIDENGELRPPPEQAPELYKESPLGLVPKSWSVCLLDDIASRGSGHTPSRSIPAYWNGGVKWVSLSDSHRLDNVFIKNTVKEISSLGIANSSAEIHPSGTVILSRDAGIGRSAIIAHEMAVSQHFIVWKCGERLHNLFLYYWLQLMKPRFEAIALGSTIQTIGLGYFRGLTIKTPPIGEQKKIAGYLLGAQEGLWSNERLLTKLRWQKDALMNDLLTGRVRVTSLLEKTQEAATA